MMFLWPLHAHPSAEFKAVFPQPTSAKGTVKVSGKRGLATAFFNMDQQKINHANPVSLLFPPRQANRFEKFCRGED